ncbi:MAG: diguanylate cyclase [Gaiellaceae bacterium]
MTSFKVKLVVYFVLLSLLPVAAAFWAFSSLAARSETRRVDTRLQAGLRAASAAYQERLNTAQVTAATLARDPLFQQKLQRHDRSGLEHMLRGLPNVVVLTPDRRRIGVRPRLAADRQVEVFTTHGLVGTVIAFVPFDTRLASRLRFLSGLGENDAVAIIDGTQIGASSPPIHGRLNLPSGATRSVSIGGLHYRALAAGSLDAAGGIRLAVLSPQALIDAVNSSTRSHLLIFLIGTLLAVALVAYVEGRSIVRTVRSLASAAHGIARGRLDERVPVRGRDEFAQLGHAFNDMADQLQARHDELEAERRRVRESLAQTGHALAATHDPAELRRVVLATTLDATSATSAALVDERGEVTRIGEAAEGADRLQLPLVAGRTSFGTLVLSGPGFDEEERLTAVSLVGQAVIALENARLHVTVEHQAAVDGLTGLANRRHCEEMLASEFARVERYGSPFALVFADLDGFKAVNDLHGHHAGDLVLREFSAVLQESVREADVAGRWGGEEFIMLLPGTDAVGAAQLAERVRESIERRVILTADGVPVTLTCSFGVATYPEAASAAELLSAADDALYRAKRGGKNRVEAAGSSVQRP